MKWPGLTKLDKYIIGKFLGTFIYSIVLITLIAVVFDLSEHIDDFFEHDATFREVVFDFYLNFIPYFIILFSSMITFISVIYFTSKMAYNTEIIAILSSGVSFNRFLRPYMISATLIAGFSFVVSNYILPPANKIRIEFAEKYFHSRPVNYSNRNIHKQISPGVFIYMESYSNTSNIGYKFSMEEFKNGKLKSKLISDYIRWDSTKSKWTIRNYYIREIHELTETIKKGTSIDTSLSILPADFNRREDVFFETMDIGALNNFINKLEMQGADNIDLYKVERDKRLAFPLSTFILTLIGVTLSSRKIKGGIGMHIGIGLGFTFSYIFLIQFSSQFAISGALSPLLAAWLPNLLFTVIVIGLYKLAPK
ncbi:MAG: LptF/LptG family permease [Bacteroidota bacterium]